MAPALWHHVLFLEATPHNAVLTFLMIFIPFPLFHAVYSSEGEKKEASLLF